MLKKNKDILNEYAEIWNSIKDLENVLMLM